MHPAVEQLLRVLDLERRSEQEFEAVSSDELGTHLFGGQVVAQALVAAQRIADGELAHSLHAHFLERGTPQRPIRFAVEELRRSRSFTTCEVRARQQDKELLRMIVSFHRPEEGPEHQIPMDEVDPPAGEAFEQVLIRAMTPEGSEEGAVPFELPIEIRGVGGLALFSREVMPPYARCWLRARGAIPDDPGLHQALFAYASDYPIIAPAGHPHPLAFEEVQVASLDHAIWFHRPLRMDDWLLFELDSPVAARARGMGRGLLFDRDGWLVASCVQESLLRPR